MHAFLLLALLAGGETAPTPEPTGLADRGQLFWSARRDQLSTGEDGSSVAVDWVGKLRRGPTLVLGAERSELADSRWALGRAGVTASLGKGTHLGVDLRLGSGTRAGGGFDYRQVEATWTQRILDRKIYLELQDRYLDVDLTRGNLLQATAILLPRSWLTLRFSHAASTGGNLDASYRIAQVDLRRGRWRWLAGLSTGRNRPPSLLTLGAPEGDFDQRFAGVAVPFFGADALLTFDDLELETLRRRAWSLVFKHSLGRGDG